MALSPQAKNMAGVVSSVVNYLLRILQKVAVYDSVI